MVHFNDTSTETLRADDGFEDVQGATFCGWIRHDSYAVSYRASIGICRPSDIGGDGTQATFYAVSNSLQVFQNDAGGSGVDTLILESAPDPSTWFFVAMVTNATSTRVYWMSEGSTSLDTSLLDGSKALVSSAGSGANTFGVGSAIITAGETMNGDIVAVKLWQAELTEVELMIESLNWRAVRRDGMRHEHRLDFPTGLGVANLSGGVAFATPTADPGAMNSYPKIPFARAQPRRLVSVAGGSEPPFLAWRPKRRRRPLR